MTCRCGTENAADARFCLACGTPLQAESDRGASTAAPPTAPATGIRRYSTPITLALVTIAAAGYYFFLRADPERDGKRAADGHCNCAVDYNDALIDVAETFATDFPRASFKRRADAWAKLTEMQAPANTASGECRTKSDDRVTTLRQRYATNQQQLAAFDFAFSGRQGACRPDNSRRLTTANEAAQRLINGITDPEPDLNQIKHDLIGQRVPVWRFVSLKEFTNATLQNVTRSANRNEYHVRFNLHSESGNTDHEGEFVVTYTLGSQGWMFHGLREISFTWDNLIPADGWTRVTPLSNHTFSAPEDKRLAWKAWDFAPEIHTGPDAPGAALPSSYQYLVRSREGAPVTVRLTYRSR